jgi:phospholipase C
MNRRTLPALLTLALTACAVEAEPDPAADPEAVAWETTSPTEELHSTHLWIVNRAVDQLGRQGTAPALRAYRLMTGAACKAQWQQGLFDADYKAPYHGGWSDIRVGATTLEIALSGADWASHFYDPSTGVNYDGDASPTARTEALSHASTAKSRLAVGDLTRGCYELGLALHYFTDITQPMHAANFTATDWPVKLHSNVEMRGMDVQAWYAINTFVTLSVGTPTSELDDAAWRSYDQWPPLWSAVERAYASRCWSINWYPYDSTSCWRGDARVDGAIGASLRTAQIATPSGLPGPAARPPPRSGHRRPSPSPWRCVRWLNMRRRKSHTGQGRSV